MKLWQQKDRPTVQSDPKLVTTLTETYKYGNKWDTFKLNNYNAGLLPILQLQTKVKMSCTKFFHKYFFFKFKHLDFSCDYYIVERCISLLKL